ncbi:MAG: folylpolyglutamate synthase/dihydrofolate synthase family protein [Sporomusaceae bacterium]|nr:folylpolyglutamate synthase/dihydrofolate synthase family protein [Sporomusaceae bacterium]
MMTYEQALAYLASLQRFGINLGLARIERLLQLLGHPERRFRSLHIAGTNGKGSTTAMLASALTAAGIRTGMYISPHLLDYTERISIDGQPVSRSGFGAAIGKVAALAEAMQAEGLEHPTEFELITAAAFDCFAAAGVEYAVIETGLGGRFDSTNVIIPEVAVITNVTVEHADRLGPELADIAGHKAGIIKAGRPVVTAAAGEALAVIRAEAAKLDSSVYALGQEFFAEAAGLQDGKQLLAFSGGVDAGQYACSLLGRHQAANAALTLMTLQLLSDPRLTAAAIHTGLAAAVWPGRFEILSRRPELIIDGAHNPDGAAALRLTLDEIYPGRPVVFVLGMLADKDIAAVTSILVRPADRVVAVKPDSPRAAEPGDIIALCTPGQAIASTTVAAGMGRAAALAGENGIVCVAGSLYQVGEARQAALGGQAISAPL